MSAARREAVDVVRDLARLELGITRRIEPRDV
jgi:hypothetical protein